MEVVLLEDVKALGKKGQVVKVNDGYARNFILPKKLGVEATSKNLNDLKLQKANAEKVAAEQLAEAKKLAEEIDKMSVTVSIKAGEGGRAFGSVSTKEIAKAAKDQLKLDIDKKKMGGIVQVGLSLQSHDPSQRSNGFLTLAGGIVITFAKEILTLITG